MIGECINLDMSLVSGKVKLTEKSGCYKDRYSTISYCNWVLSFFDQELLKETEDNSMSDLEFLTSITKVW